MFDVLATIGWPCNCPHAPTVTVQGHSLTHSTRLDNGGSCTGSWLLASQDVATTGDHPIAFPLTLAVFQKGSNH
jgi:hypothetical protein